MTSLPTVYGIQHFLRYANITGTTTSQLQLVVRNDTPAFLVERAELRLRGCQWLATKECRGAEQYNRAPVPALPSP